MKKLLLFGATTLLLTGMSFAQTGKDTNKDTRGKAKDSTRTSTVKPCPGKTCGKKKG
jgi:hypothetical protein